MIFCSHFSDRCKKQCEGDYTPHLFMVCFAFGSCLCALVCFASDSSRRLPPFFSSSSSNLSFCALVDHNVAFCLQVWSQGPNYAFAKLVQRWRVLLARASGHVVSANVAPASLTRSVMHNKLIRAGAYTTLAPSITTTVSQLYASTTTTISHHPRILSLTRSVLHNKLIRAGACTTFNPTTS
jgi:hypothetical protein